MTIAYVFFSPVAEKKWRKRNQSRVKEKLTTFFTKNCTPKGMSRKRVAHSDNIIVSLFTMGCCKVLSSLNVWEFFFNHKALVPLRRVNYNKHVKFDLRDNITSRDVTKKSMDLAGAGSKARYSGNSPQNPVLKTPRNGYLDLSLRRTRKKKVMVSVNEFDQAFRFSTKPHRK